MKLIDKSVALAIIRGLPRLILAVGLQGVGAILVIFIPAILCRNSRNGYPILYAFLIFAGLHGICIRLLLIGPNPQQEQPNNALQPTSPLPLPQRVRLAVQAMSQVNYAVRPLGRMLSCGTTYKFLQVHTDEKNELSVERHFDCFCAFGSGL
ncbi:MAG: hypothetical protein ACRYFS_07525 [Janthinobacterium lividum]